MARRLLGVALGLVVGGLAAGAVAALGVTAGTSAATAWLFGTVDWLQLLGRMLAVVLIASVAAVVLVIATDLEEVEA